MNIGYLVTFLLSFVGTFAFARTQSCSYEIAFYWAIGWACISVSVHRLIRGIANSTERL